MEKSVEIDTRYWHRNPSEDKKEHRHDKWKYWKEHRFGGKNENRYGEYQHGKCRREISAKEWQAKMFKGFQKQW